MNVYFCSVVRVKRGHYKCYAERLDNSVNNGNEEWPITDAYIGRLQQQIRKHPELWLWSHDRWRR